MAALHSRYNPQAEAERYLDALSIPPRVRCFILIEPGLGYMIPILSRRFPGARIIVFHVLSRSGAPSGTPEGTLSGTPDGENTVYWDPALGVPPEDFLGRELEELAGGGNRGDPGTGGGACGPGFGPESIKIVEWRPSLDLYGESYVKLLAAAVAAVKRFDAERRTVSAFGRRWFRNFFKNLRLPRRFPLFRGLQEAPILVTGSGPSLEESLPLIKTLWERRSCFIIAASSSVMALFHRGIAPNLVLSTDGGGWALFHLYELFRDKGLDSPGGGLAASLSAGLPSQCGGLPILGIADGSLWQSLILRGLALPHLVLPQRGTVTATALDLALALGRGKVIIAGMDLDTRDIRTHARPYGFDRLWREGASRFRGEYTQGFFRQTAAREGGSYRIYAEWFASRLASYGGRLCSLGNNNPLFAGLPPVGPEDLPAGAVTTAAATIRPIQPNHAVPIRPGNTTGTPAGRGLEILRAALEDAGTRQTIVKELAPLIFPGKPVPGKDEFRAELESLVRPYTSPSGPGESRV
jgi:hypothetical protein